LSAAAGAQSADVCVVGGGLAGLSAALNLAERGFSVTCWKGRPSVLVLPGAMVAR
jgi:gamma-glutamylputrescine oxidase